MNDKRAEQATPLSEKRLAEIRASLEQVHLAVQAALNPPPTIVKLREPATEQASVPVSTIFMAMNAMELLAEVERQRASLAAKEEREAALAEALAAIVAPLPALDGVQLSSRRVVGISPEFIEQARALLAAASAGEPPTQEDDHADL